MGNIIGRFLLPHPPAAVPEVGGAEYGQRLTATLAGFETVAAKVKALSPATVVVISPHAPNFSRHFYLPGEKRVSGDFSAFGAGNVLLGFDNDVALVKAIADRAEAHGLAAGPVDDKVMRQKGVPYDLDHGVLVPLYFLNRAAPVHAVCAVSLTDLGAMDHYRFGIALREAVAAHDGDVVIVAGGDLSHKLSDDGPYGFREEGPIFDKTVKKALLNEDVFGLLTIDPKLKERAAQCGLDSYRILLGTLDGFRFTTEIFSYEGPLGVGYLTAELTAGKACESVVTHWQEREQALLASRREAESDIVAFARKAIAHHLATGDLYAATAEEKAALDDITCYGLFVSLHIDGKLRGCIGTTQRIESRFSLELADYAASAATKDPRFPPLTEAELATATIGVDLLDAPEDADETMLDPRKYGVIVSSKGKVGLLLPDIEGIDTVKDQLEIAAAKAAIHPWRKKTIQRFTVQRYE